MVISDGCFQNNTNIGGSKYCESFSAFSLLAEARWSSALNLFKTLFVILLLVSGSALFTKDAESLVILPIERMVNMIKKLAENPLQQALVEKEEDSQNQKGYEIKLLENTLEKIGMLLQVGFGVAGDAIIGNNIGGGGELNPMIPGRKLYALFGFCDIRYFVVATESLQEDIMVFVNKIAFIVHGCVHLYGGSANKNIGEAWLLVWKLPKASTDDIIKNVGKKEAPPVGKRALKGSPDDDDEAKLNDSLMVKGTGGAFSTFAGFASTDTDEKAKVTPTGKRRSLGAMPAISETDGSRNSKKTPKSPISGPLSPSLGGSSKVLAHAGSLTLPPVPTLSLTEIISQLADNALASFIKVIVDVYLSITQSGSLAEYTTHPKLVKMGWKITMGFGLHIGWAIEGAIGSIHKIDASYLSPHVNMASRLEAATKQYGVKLLFSHLFYKLLSPAAQNMCRKLDCVTVKGSAIPIELYTFDIADIKDTIGSDEDLRARKGHPPFRMVNFETDTSIHELQKSIPEDFKTLFKEGVEDYLGGKWELARDKLEQAKVSRILFDFLMIEYFFHCI